jgi:hypothetical protein
MCIKLRTDFVVCKACFYFKLHFHFRIYHKSSPIGRVYDSSMTLITTALLESGTQDFNLYSLALFSETKVVDLVYG